LRPKYRDSLKRWFSELGGGSGNIWDFQDYCGNERWLAWVYMIDATSGFFYVPMPPLFVLIFSVTNQVSTKAESLLSAQILPIN